MGQEKKKKGIERKREKIEKMEKREKERKKEKVIEQ